MLSCVDVHVNCSISRKSVSSAAAVARPQSATPRTHIKNRLSNNNITNSNTNSNSVQPSPRKGSRKRSSTSTTAANSSPLSAQQKVAATDSDGFVYTDMAADCEVRTDTQVDLVLVQILGQAVSVDVHGLLGTKKSMFLQAD